MPMRTMSIAIRHNAVGESFISVLFLSWSGVANR
jgi:hypothetical protein